MVTAAVNKIIQVIVAVGLTLVVWTLVIGTDGLLGKSIMKENLWHGVQATYTAVIKDKTDDYGYGSIQRMQVAWDAADTVMVTDMRSAQA